MYVCWGGAHRSHVFSGQWRHAGGMSPVCQDALTLSAQGRAAVSVLRQTQNACPRNLPPMGHGGNELGSRRRREQQRKHTRRDLMIVSPSGDGCMTMRVTEGAW